MLSFAMAAAARVAVCASTIAAAASAAAGDSAGIGCRDRAAAPLLDGDPIACFIVDRVAFLPLPRASGNDHERGLEILPFNQTNAGLKRYGLSQTPAALTSLRYSS
jgi:hypothetical protein